MLALLGWAAPTNRFVGNFQREMDKMTAEYESQMRSTISLVCDGLLTIMNPDCAEDLVVRADIKASCVWLCL